ncbi:hypothetical protein Droror1_Dr00026132 [Drosera rotundifolia]
METSKSSSNQEDEDFIEMELTNYTSSSKNSKEFEFHMSTIQKESASSSPCPADELFYKGKLLPLQLPPRLRMVRDLLLEKPGFEDTKPGDKDGEEDEEEQCRRIGTVQFIGTSFTAPPTNSNTPLESCNISPAESCRASCELNPDEYFFRWSTIEVSGLIGRRQQPKSTWSRKIRLMRDSSSLSQKLKASKTYMKSLFMKAAACSDESSTNAKAAETGEGGNVHSKAKEYLNKYIKLGRKIPFGHFEKQVMDEDTFLGPRRSFSGAIKRHCGTKCISSSSSSSSSQSSSASSSSSLSSSNSSTLSVKSSGFYEINFLKKSSSVNSEIESAIEGAIAHCKKSQQKCSIKPETGNESCSYTAAAKVAACEDNSKSELSRI